MAHRVAQFEASRIRYDSASFISALCLISLYTCIASSVCSLLIRVLYLLHRFLVILIVFYCDMGNAGVACQGFSGSFTAGYRSQNSGLETQRVSDEPRHEKTCCLHICETKGADQLPRS